MPTVQRSKAGKHIARQQTLFSVGARPGSDQLCPHATTISVLPDEVFLEIFAYVLARTHVYSYAFFVRPTDEDEWHTLVQVCKRWRHIVFASPHRLDLQLLCTNSTPVKKSLDIWPALPIYIYAHHRAGKSPLRGVTNITAALNQIDRVGQIRIYGVPNSLLKRLAATRPFPALTHLGLFSRNEGSPVLPDSFLGGSAPSLRILYMGGISFPGLGKLLVSTTELVTLCLHHIPRSGYIPPDVMVANLSTLTKLKFFELLYQSPRSRADRGNQHRPPLPRIVLPALTSLLFKGDAEYLEDILSRIDCPPPDSMGIIFFNQLVFNTPQLRHFLSRTGKFKAADGASLEFCHNNVAITFSQKLSFRISCIPSDWQLSSIAQLYKSALSPLPTLGRLEIQNHRPSWQDDIENVQWLELLRLFTSVKDLVLSETMFRLVAPALDELVGESVTEVLPVLQNVTLQGPHPLEPDNKAIEKFIATRRLLGCPVTVQYRYGRTLDFTSYWWGYDLDPTLVSLPVKVSDS